MLKRVQHFWVCCVIDCVCKRVSQERQPAWNPYFIVVPAITSGEGKLYSTRPLQLKTAFPLRGGLNVPWAVLQKYIHYLCKYVITSRYKAPITSHHITSVLCNFIKHALCFLQLRPTYRTQTKPRSLALARHSATHELSKRKGSITSAATSIGSSTAVPNQKPCSRQQ